ETKPYHYQLDHLGTPQELTSPEGEIVWSAHYRAYGQIARLDVGNIDNPLRFQGQYFDAESGLHYNRHRYYNPDIGRYLTPDPVKLAGGINGYQYVPNPTGWVDPLGLSKCPGKCGSIEGVEDSTTSAKTKDSQPALPAPDEIEWTAHGYKHSPSKKMPWKDILATTKSGPAKYKPGINIENIEREAYKNGRTTTNGKPWKVMEYPETIGASEGVSSRWIRIELSAKTIHGHPISEQEFRRLTK
ncbi:RHS repeat domain-containing protein, partial [Pseudomonas sp. Env-17]|uniref:RHS repeat domain-containing protein n=4 Tax=Pseudomonas TaxID=286 RepID=UPI0035227E58